MSNGVAPLLADDVRKYIDEGLPKIKEEDAKELMSKKDEILRKIDKMKIDPEAQKRARLYLEIAEAWVEKRYIELTWEDVKPFVFALKYLLKKHDLIVDWHPIVGLDDDSLVVNEIARRYAQVIQKFLKLKEEKA